MQATLGMKERQGMQIMQGMQLMQGMQGMQGPKQGALASPLSPPLANSRAPTSVAAADTTSPYVNGDPHDGISVKRTLKSC